MVVKPITMNTVNMRKNYKLDTREETNVSRLYETARISIVENHDEWAIKEAMSNYFKSCSTKKNIDREYGRCLSLLEGLYDQKKYQLFEEMKTYFGNYVLPYHPDMKSVKEQTKKYNIGESNIIELCSIAENYRLCDRVLNNHEKISKRFHVDSLFEKKLIDFDDMIFNLCEMVDTYTMRPPVKMEIAIEEAKYQLDRYDIDYNESKLIESVTDYFLSREDNSSSNLSFDYGHILKESKFISERACDLVKYITEGYTESDSSDPLSLLESMSSDNEIQKLMNKYKMEEEKSDTKMRQVLNKIFTKDPALVVEELPDILKWVRNFGVLLVAAVSAPAGLVALIANSFLKSNLEKDRMAKVIRYFNAEKDKMEDKMYSYDSEEKQEKIQKYIDALDDAIEKMKKYENNLYTDDQNSDREFEDEGFDESYNLESMNKLVLNNLITDSQEAAEFITTVGDRVLNEKKAKKTEIKDNIDESTYPKYISDNGRIDIVLCSYDISNVEDKYALSETAETIISTVNNMIYNKCGKVYGIFKENTLDFCFKSKFSISTTLAEDVAIQNTMADSDIMRVSNILEASSNITNLYHSPISNIKKVLESKDLYKLSQSQIEYLFEAWSLYGVPFDTPYMMTVFSKYGSMLCECGDYLIEDELARKCGSCATSYNTEASIEDQIEGINTMNQIISEGVNLNSLKLAMMSFQKKAKDFNAKQKEISRDMDATFNHFIKSIKQTYTVDHREQIIRGQVNPSLSKIIKMGIGLAALGVASNSIVLPAIAAVAGLAQSKHISYKEKKLILDEIDIELKVLDREIKRVEDGNKSSKKYRTLLTYQKNLQNERARILYGLKKSGKLTSVPKLGGDD